MCVNIPNPLMTRTNSPTHSDNLPCTWDALSPFIFLILVQSHEMKRDLCLWNSGVMFCWWSVDSRKKKCDNQPGLSCLYGLLFGNPKLTFSYINPKLMSGSPKNIFWNPSVSPEKVKWEPPNLNEASTGFELTLH